MTRATRQLLSRGALAHSVRAVVWCNCALRSGRAFYKTCVPGSTEPAPLLADLRRRLSTTVASASAQCLPPAQHLPKNGFAAPHAGSTLTTMASAKTPCCAVMCVVWLDCAEWVAKSDPTQSSGWPLNIWMPPLPVPLNSRRATLNLNTAFTITTGNRKKNMNTIQFATATVLRSSMCSSDRTTLR